MSQHRTRVQKLGYSDYSTYLASKHWEKVKKTFLESHEPKCFVCSSFSELNIHHTTYENLGNEQNKDLVWLCRKHHEQIHKKSGFLIDPNAHFDLRRAFLQKTNKGEFGINQKLDDRLVARLRKLGIRSTVIANLSHEKAKKIAKKFEKEHKSLKTKTKLIRQGFSANKWGSL